MGGCGRIINGVGAALVKTWWRVEDNAVAGMSQTINIQWTAPTWVRLVQLTANWATVPLTSENITLIKDHTGTAFDVVLRSIDPSTTGLNLTDWVCNEEFYFEPGEIASLTYANTDDQAVGAELYFEKIG